MGEVGDFIGGAVGSITGPLFGVNDAKDTAKDAAAATWYNNFLARKSQKNMYDESLGYVTPYHEQAGLYALPYLQNLISGEGKQFDVTASPSYLWQLEQGEKGINRDMAARGLYNSSAALSQLSNFRQALGAQETDRTWGRLLDMTKIGQMSAGQAGASSMATGNTLASLYQDQGKDLANNYMNVGQLSTMYSPGNIALGALGAFAPMM